MDAQSHDGVLLAGVDTGGTFTDVVLYSAESGKTHFFKVPSTPDDPSAGIFAGLEQLTTSIGGSVAAVRELRHGTTVGTNALIQGRVAKTALVTTEGFRDVIEIRRQQRPDIYDLRVPKPHAIATRDLRLGLSERTRPDGSIKAGIDPAALEAVAAKLEAAGVEAVAVCYLHSYANPANERETRERLESALPGVFVSISSELAPEFREYPRVSTTVVNASLGPVMGGYLTNLAARAERAGMPPSVWVMHSNGGVMSTSAAAVAPAKTISSGPSAGVVAAAAIAAEAGVDDAVTFDMGGTSTDVCLVVGGDPLMVPEKTIVGHPLRLPTFDVQSVGGGGGSIARIDSGGFLRVGPASAGACPGPACYGLGGRLATVTDANVVLGRMNPERILGGRMSIDAPAARRVLAELGEGPGLDAVEAAAGVIAILNAEMVSALRLQTVQRGYDPREFALIAFGGAGPLHAVEIAREVGFRRVVIPATPGLLCALGLLIAELRSDFSRTRYVLADGERASEEARAVFRDLEEQVRDWLHGEARHRGRLVRTRSVDMRFQGQSYELNVPLTSDIDDPDWLERLEVDFREQYQRRYGQHVDRPAELVTFRAHVTIARDERWAGRVRAVDSGTEETSAPTAERQVFFAGHGSLRSPVIHRPALRPGDRISGPAIVEQPDCTTVIPPDVEGVIDGGLHMSLVL